MKSAEQNFLKNLTENEWIDLLAGKFRQAVPFQLKIPKLPSDDVQIATAGKAGSTTLQEASDFYHLVRSIFEAHGGNSNDAKVLDFGCGWGRITRLFLKDFQRENILGLDVRSSIIQMAQELAPFMEFKRIDPFPPVPMDSASVDLIVAYSVFSHLSEDAAKQWIEEFARITRKGGLVCVTTRARNHLVNSAKMKDKDNLPNALQSYADMIKDFEEAISRYDRGEFVFAPTGGGSELSKEFYGEAIIPKDYVLKNWLVHFDFLDFADGYSSLAQQPVIILRRRQ